MARFFFRFKSKKNFLLELDETLLDASNLPKFDKQQFEGVLEKPISQRVALLIGVLFVFIFIVFIFKAFLLQIINGDKLYNLSENNTLRHSAIFAERGVIYDRNNIELAWNTPERSYIKKKGLSHLLGYVSYPTKTEINNLGFDPKEFVGRSGSEKLFNENLRGINGTKIEEVDVAGELQSQGILSVPKEGKNIVLSIDSKIQEKLFGYIKNLSIERGFTGGAGIIMNVKNGEIVAMVSYPETSSQVLSDATDKKTIASYQNNPDKPFLNRAVQGQYTPGSIFKPFIASAALQEEIIDPEKIIVTTGALYIPNPYYPEQFTIFRDWRDQGPVNMYDALAVSSNVYFFELGGGFENQEGLGIKRIEKYSKIFGFGKKTSSGISGEAVGIIPTPSWKEKTFGEKWRIGDTYNTSIGQYGYQVTPIQVVRAISSIANGGTLFNPIFIKDSIGGRSTIPISPKYLKIVRDGMRQAVIRGTAKGLSISGVKIAAKTGTAEIDYGKKFVNSWVIGFFPYEDPKYAFTVVMEKGPRENYIGGVFVMRQLIEWMLTNTPEYFKLTSN